MTLDVAGFPPPEPRPLPSPVRSPQPHPDPAPSPSPGPPDPRPPEHEPDPRPPVAGRVVRYLRALRASVGMAALGPHRGYGLGSMT
jgi:hypothetical protein